MQDHSHYRCNYGLYFRFWDRLCGTDRGLARF
jgi:sterol desaturase/sphingolipid hydroxylase (fatty acid hydroxylase superfamily)